MLDYVFGWYIDKRREEPQVYLYGASVYQPTRARRVKHGWVRKLADPCLPGTRICGRHGCTSCQLIHSPLSPVCPMEANAVPHVSTAIHIEDKPTKIKSNSLHLHTLAS